MGRHGVGPPLHNQPLILAMLEVTLVLVRTSPCKNCTVLLRSCLMSEIPISKHLLHNSRGL